MATLGTVRILMLCTFVMAILSFVAMLKYSVGFSKYMTLLITGYDEKQTSSSNDTWHSDLSPISASNKQVTVETNLGLNGTNFNESRDERNGPLPVCPKNGSELGKHFFIFISDNCTNNICVAKQIIPGNFSTISIPRVERLVMRYVPVSFCCLDEMKK